MTSPFLEGAILLQNHQGSRCQKARPRGRPPGLALDGDAIRRRRQTMDMTQIEFASHVRVSHRTVVAAESGRRVSTTTARAIADGLQLELEALLQSPAPPGPHN